MIPLKATISNIANRLWYLSCMRETKRFHSSLDSVAATQEQLLLDMLDQNRSCMFGEKHGFSKIKTVHDYQDAVPLREYRDFAPYIERICLGENNVLTAEPVKLLEPTGGSSGGSKLIPYTAGLKRQFQRGIAPWIVDLFRNNPKLMNGESYWSVTPVVTDNLGYDGVIPIGFEDDSEYVGGLGQMFVRATQAVPDRVKNIKDMETFWYLTLLFLLKSRRLALISIWNPTFLTILDSHLNQWWPDLANDIANGRMSVSSSSEFEIIESLNRHNRPDPKRAEEIIQACSTGMSCAETYKFLWPNLQLISCWSDGAAEEPAKKLATFFPAARIQGKGLIATEGFFSFPMNGIEGCLPAFRSHFLEFISIDDGDIRLLYQLEKHKTYSLLVTTAGGLYRYRVHDLIRVTGFLHDLPLIEFVGKDNHTSDRFGEKLHEEHVHNVIKQVSEVCELSPLFSMLAFEETPAPAYIFYVEDPAADDKVLCNAGVQIDTQLMDNFQYRHCRQLGQLGSVQVFRVSHGGQQSYLRKCTANGQRLGSVKPLSLQNATGWKNVFHGRMLG